MNKHKSLLKLKILRMSRQSFSTKLKSPQKWALCLQKWVSSPRKYHSTHDLSSPEVHAQATSLNATRLNRKECQPCVWVDLYEKLGLSRECPSENARSKDSPWTRLLPAIDHTRTTCVCLQSTMITTCGRMTINSQVESGHAQRQGATRIIKRMPSRSLWNW